MATNQEIKDGIIFKKVNGTWGLHIKESLRDEFTSADVQIKIQRNDNWDYCSDNVYKCLRFCQDASDRYGICNDYASELVPRSEHSHVVDLKATQNDSPNSYGVALIRWSINAGDAKMSSSFSSDQFPRGTEQDDIDLNERVTFYPFMDLNGITNDGDNLEGAEFNYQNTPKGNDDRKKPVLGSGLSFFEPGDCRLLKESITFPKTMEFRDDDGEDANATLILDSPNLKVKNETSLTKLLIKTSNGIYKGKDVGNNQSVIVDRVYLTNVGFYPFDYEGNNGKNNGMPDKVDDKTLRMFDGCDGDGMDNTIITIHSISNIARAAQPEPEPEPEPTPVCTKTLDIEFEPSSSMVIAATGSPVFQTIQAEAVGVATSRVNWTFKLVGPEEELPHLPPLALNARSLSYPATCGQTFTYRVQGTYTDSVCNLTCEQFVTLSTLPCSNPDPNCDRTLYVTVDKPLTTGHHLSIDRVEVKALANGVPTDGCLWTWTLQGASSPSFSGYAANVQTLDFPDTCGVTTTWIVQADWDDTTAGGGCVLSATTEVKLVSTACPIPPPPPPVEPILIEVEVGGPCPTTSSWNPTGWGPDYVPTCADSPAVDRTEDSLGGLILRQDPSNKQKLNLTFGSLEGAFNPIRQTLGLNEFDKNKSLANKLITIKVAWKRSANWAQRFRVNASCADIKEGSTLQSGGAPYSRPGIDYSTAASSSPSSAHDKDFIIYNIDGSSTVTLNFTSTPGAAPTRNYFTGETVTVVDSPQDDTKDPPEITRTITTTCVPPGGVNETYSPWPPCTPEVFVTKSGGTKATAVYSDGAPDGPNGDQEIEITFLGIRECTTVNLADSSFDDIAIQEELEKTVWLTSTTPASASNLNGVQGWSLADYHEHSDKARFRNPALRTSISNLDSGGTKMSEFSGVAGALFPGTIDTAVSNASALPVNFSQS